MSFPWDWPPPPPPPAPSSSTPAALPVGNAGTVGVSTAYSRGDHVHPITAGSPVLLTVGNVAAAGVSASAARADHVHQVDPMIPPTAFLGSALKYWWQMTLALTGDPNVTVAAGNVTGLRERVGSGNNMVVAAGATTYTATGGPGDRSFATPATAAAVMNCNAGTPAGSRYAWYLLYRVKAFATVGNARIPWVGGVGVTGHVFFGRASGADNYVTQVDFTGGTQGLNIVTPANDFSWHLHSILPLSTGAKYQIDGVDTVPNFTGNDTVVQTTAQAIGFGGFSGGDVVFAMILDTTVGNFAANDAYIQAYSRALAGIGRP